MFVLVGAGYIFNMLRVLSYVVSILSLSLEPFAQRDCSPGKFCPIGANCTSDTFCVTVCASQTDLMQQGNHLTGNCERSKLACEIVDDTCMVES